MNALVERLFHDVADLPEAARMRYFAEHHVDDDTRREVEALLAYEPGASTFLLHDISAAASRALPQMEATGRRCGPFRLVSVIGRGGMGVVYLAERVDGEVRQRAAVKLMHPGWSEVQRDRFLREREILAGLAHPGIAHLLDAGHLDDGQPYLAMEYVEGQPIDRYCEGFSVRQKVALFLKVCAAVAYLHRSHVLHRDLKPTNILLTALGEPKLLDFGIAKIVDLDGDAAATQLRMLTPDYASPEQVAGGVVGTQSDVYALGAVLHRLLTGQPPQKVRPSQLAPELKGDLEIILQKALRNEPEERYTSVEQFSDDLAAWLESRAIHARHGDRWYRARTFVRRNAFNTALIGSVVTALLSAGVLARNRVRPAASVEQLRLERVTANTPELPIQAAAIAPDGRSIAYSDPLGVHVRDIASGKTRVLPGTGGHVLVRWLSDGARLQTQLQDVSGAMQTMVVSTLGRAPAPASLTDVAVASPDRKYLAAASADDQRLSIQDASGGNTRDLWSAAAKGRLQGFQWSPDSKRIGVWSANESASTLELIDVGSGRRTVLIPPEKQLWIDAMVWARPLRIIVAIREPLGPNSYNSNLWEATLDAGGTLVPGGLRKSTAWTDFPIRPGSLTTDGRRLVFVRSLRQRDVYVAAVDAGRSRMGTPHRLTLDLGDDYPTAWTPDSRTVILTSDRNGEMAIFRQDLGAQAASLLVAGPGRQILPRVTPDGRSLLFCRVDPATRTDLLMRTPIAGGTPELLMEVPRIRNFRCSSAGPCVIVQRQDRGQAVFELDLAKKSKGREIYRDADDRSSTPDISPDGKWLAASSTTEIVLRSFSTGGIVRKIPVRGVTNLLSLDYAPDGQGFFAGNVTPTEARLLYVDRFGKSSVLWRQAGSPLIWGVPAPDGRHVALMMFTDDSNVYMVEHF
jgi:Tol biopolymer transport system component/tRNA A-37 threonylcarbamoyl transferase component Bud32